MKKTIADWDYEQGIKKGHDDGFVEALRKTILRIGTKRLGAPGPRLKKQLLEIGDIEKLEALCDRVLDVPSWRELLSE